MSKKEDLLDKLFNKQIPRNFTTRELDTLMRLCGCTAGSGGRGSAISYIHEKTGRVLIFDGPHPENELYPYQVKKVRKFLEEIKEE